MANNVFRKNGRPTGLTRGLALVTCFTLQIGPLAPLASAQSIIRNGTNTGITTPGFLFEPEVPFTSLKAVPIWNELEQLLDNPYLVSHDPNTPGNDQGFPSYRATGVTRRPGFGVTLPSLLVHPLNYNTTTGEEMRLLNPQFPGATFPAISEDGLVEDPPGTFTWPLVPTSISPGSSRMERSSIDYNNPIGRDDPFCAVTAEMNPPEGSLLCGGDPGEPNYFGFGVRNLTGYSVPAIQLPAGSPTSTVIPANARLFDPDRGVINPRNFLTGAGGLNKPTVGRNGQGAPQYAAASTAGIASNENDYFRGNTFLQKQAARSVAAALGKAFFWDMQVGSDGVQSCGTCHFNGTGTDTRTKNQVNPNHIGGDNTFQLMQPNERDLVASDFPLLLLAQPDVAGDPLCTPALFADTTAIPYMAQVAGYADSQRFSNPVRSDSFPVCNAANKLRDTNDVVSSMGVVFNKFIDIAPIGSFLPPVNGVRAVAPEPRTTGNPTVDAEQAVAIDPITGFQTFRRVEPRNTPTMQAAAFNFDNFWDGRARHDFNGGSVFGAADPQAHVFVTNVNPQGNAAGLTATRQVIRFVSISSLATGPGLSEFEMSFLGRNWAKIGKKLLQAGVTPLANQLVDPTDSLLGIYSNQGGSACGNTTLVPVADRSASWAATGVVGKPGLCISYPGLIRQAFYPQLWANTTQHRLIGCYTDGNAALHPNQCGTTVGGITYPAAAIQVLGSDGTVQAKNNDPFDGYVLSIMGGAAVASDRNQFTQMEGNFSLFWGLAINAWVTLLVPDNTPFDQFLDANPDAFETLGEPGEAGLVGDQLVCDPLVPNQRYCFKEFGNFKRDNNVVALRFPTGEGGAGGTLVGGSGPGKAGGTRTPGSNEPDPLLGLDIFFASNLSLKNPNFRTGRCGECHAIPTLTDHTMPFTSKINLMDAVAEFATPGIELVVEPLARLRVITGFLLEAELTENGQDAVERRFVDQSLIPNPSDGLAYPGGLKNPTGKEVCGNDSTRLADGSCSVPIPAGVPGDSRYAGADAAFLDNGIYNLGVRPIHEDVGRGGTDAFNWPLSLTALMMKNLEGTAYNPGGDAAGPVLVAGLGGGIRGYPQPPAPGIAMMNFNPELECFGLFEATGQDEHINPGCEGEPAVVAFADQDGMGLPAYLGAFANNITVGDFPPEMDEAGGAIGGMVNTLTDVAMIEGFMDTLGPFNPANTSAEVLNFGGWSDRPGDQPYMMGTWPNVNRVGRMGSFKAPQLRNVELTGPYFHNGGKLTLRQVVDFYTRGGDFPVSNAAHRDFNLVNMNIEIQSNLSEEEKTALVDFLLELTDERNRFDQAPFDHPEVIIPVDGLAPDNTGRNAMLLNPLFRSVPAVGAAGQATPEPTFLNVTKTRVSGADAFRDASAACMYTGANVSVSHYCR